MFIAVKMTEKTFVREIAGLDSLYYDDTLNVWVRLLVADGNAVILCDDLDVLTTELGIPTSAIEMISESEWNDD